MERHPVGDAEAMPLQGIGRGRDNVEVDLSCANAFQLYYKRAQIPGAAFWLSSPSKGQF